MKLKRKKFRLKAINLSKFHLKHKFFAFFCVLFISVFLYLKYVATPIIIANTETQIGNFATRSINYAIADTISQNVSYGDLVNIVKDGEDNIIIIKANAVRINILSKTMSKVVMNNFLEFAKNPIKIPLGVFSGISIFSGLGPTVAFNVKPYGEVYAYFTSSFESAGINQTHHKIYLNVLIKVNVVMPFRKIVVNSSSDVLLCENLIVGKIPEVYLNSTNLTDMFNLVPERFSS